MRDARNFKKKYMLLAIIMIALFALSGCRTRITNNSEVSNIHYDEDGFLTETYQMRRDELGLSTAERPILPDLGTPEADDDFDNAEDENALQNYTPEPEEPYVEPPETNTNTNTTTTNTGTTTRTTTTTRRTHTGTSTSSSIVVSFDANGGDAVNGGMTVKNGEKYGSLPTPKRKGYKFKEWNTKKDGSGNTITKDSKVKKTRDHTLYAQWTKSDDSKDKEKDKKEEEEKKDEEKKDEEKKDIEITITFDANGGSPATQDKVFVKGSALEYPSQPKKENNEFEGWYTSAEGGNLVREGSSVTANTTYFAHWKEKKVNPKISYDVNGGEGSYDDITVEDGKFVIPDGEPTREGYDFVGWFTDKKEGTQIYGGEAIEVDTTLYARWKINGDYWNNKLADSIPPKEEDYKKCYVPGGESPAIFASAGVNTGGSEEENDFVIVVSDDDDAGSEYSKSDVIVIPKDSDNQLAYGIALAKIMYEIKDKDISDKVIEDLNGGKAPKIKLKKKS